MRTPRAFIALMLACFALTGCVKLEMAIKIDPGNETLDGSFIVAVSRPVLTQDGRSVEQGFALTEQNLKQVPQGTRSEVFDDGKFYGRKIIFDAYPIAEFNRLNPAVSITHADGKFAFRADGSDAIPTTVPPEVQKVLEEVEIIIAVTFPGKVIDNDSAATVRGTTVNWRMKLADFGQIQATSQEAEDFPWLLLVTVTGLFGALVIVGIIVLALRMNRKPQQVTPIPPIG